MASYWLNNEKPKRKKSIAQERKFAKEVKGRVTSNSGATFRENDVKNADFSFELKLTSAKQFTLKVTELKKAFLRAGNKVPVFVIEFENEFTVCILEKTDFLRLCENEK